MLLALINRNHLKKRDVVWLEITPPSSIVKTPEATEQLFMVIHGLYGVRRLKDKLLRRSPVFSFEIMSTNKSGIRYLVQTERRFAASLEKAVAAYVPEAKVKEVKAPVDKSDYAAFFKQSGHYAYPLSLTTGFDQHDPLAYVTNAMTKLQANECVTLQLVISPVKLRSVSLLAKRIRNYEDISSLGDSSAWLHKLSDVINNILWALVDMVSEAGGAYGSINSAKSSPQAPNGTRPARSLSAFELELMESMNQKVSSPLFRVDLRVFSSGKRAKEHVKALRVALDGYSVPLHQSLKARLPVLRKHRRKLTDSRLPGLRRSRSLILSASEVAGLYHFSPSSISRTDNLVTSLSRTLPAPISLKQGAKFAVVLGENIHHGVETPIGLSEPERERHVYIIGGTGNGKTTMLQYSIVQDLQNGKGLAVIDPHGDMAETLLRYVPEDRIKDVVYFNPDDLEHPIGLNLLELTPGLEGTALLREKDLITESVISIFRKIFSDEDSGGHRVEYVLRNAIQTALTVEDATLFTVFRLLEDPTYRSGVVKTLDNKDLKNFWNNELGKAGAMQRVKMAAGITAKIGRFLFSASARQILEQPKSTIDFDDIVNSGKILICNFSKGLIGEDTSELFGITVLAKLQIASLRRARIKQSERRPFYIYVDEFQNFATTSFVQMLSEARKYRIFVIMAEQSTSQQKDQQMVSVILANVGTVVCFRTGNPEDERLLLPLFAPRIEPGEISNLDAFNFYIRLSAIKAQEPLSGETLLLENDGSEEIAQTAIKVSQAKYTRKQTPKIIKKTADEVTTKSSNKSTLAKKVTTKKQGLPDQVRS